MKAMSQIIPRRKVSIIFFLIAVVLFSTLNPNNLSFAYAQQGGSISLSGWLIILRGDSQDGSAKEIHMLNTEDGKSIPLVLGEDAAKSAGTAGGLLALDRKRITVDGTWSGAPSVQGGAAAFRVTSIAPLQAPDAAPSAPSGVTGPQKWISIMCKFQGNTAQPQNLSYFQNMYTNSYPGLDHYWRQQSYNLINTVGSTASGWYTLPHPHSYYMSGAWFDLDKAAVDCTGVANPSVNFSTYAGINLMFNAELDDFAWGGGKHMTLDGVTKVWDMTWEPPWGYENVAVLGHEMGHALGLPHSSGDYGLTYDNEWDVMSDTWSGCDRTDPDPVYGCLGQHTISYHKDILGWIPATQKTTVGAGIAKTVILEQLALPQTSNHKMVKIPIGGSNTRFYTVEARRLTGYDVQLPGNAVVIHDVDTTRHESPAHVIDIDNDGETGDAGAMWTTGEVFRNNTYKIAMAVLGTTTTGFRVYVSSGLNIYFIGGNIGISNVTINYTGGSTTTDSTGRYMFPVSAGWSGTVTPVKAGYVFSPASRSYSNVAADQLTQNYSQYFSISGNTGVAGATLSYTSGGPQSVTSQGNGNYSLSVPVGWTGIVTPSHACFSFSPANRGYSSLAGHQTFQNFTPTFNSGAGCANINAKIGGANQGWFGLEAGASTRASFTEVDDGPVQILSNNGIPLIAAERLIYKANGVNTSFTEMMGLPNSELDNVYYLPWYNNVNLDTQLRFANVTNSPGTVTVTIGGTAMAPINLAAGESTRVSYTGVDSGPVKIESNVNIVAAERVIYNVNGVNTSFSEMMALPEKQLDMIYWLPWYNNVGLDTQLRIANVSTAPATVNVTIGGIPMAPLNLAAGESTRVSYPGVDNGPVQIVSDQNIVAAERLIYKVNNVNTSFTETMALPDNQLNTTYWLPWYNNVDLDTQLRFANVSGSTATIHVYVGGDEMAGSPFTLGVGESIRMSYAGVNNGPVQIVSDVNIVTAERVIYKVNGINTSFSEMMGLPNSLLNSSFWFPWYNNTGLDTQLRFAAP
jgi:M6 family metalloprotease-like protein